MIHKTSSFSIGFNLFSNCVDLDTTKKFILCIKKFKFIFINIFSIYFSDYYGFAILEIANHRYNVYDKFRSNDIKTDFDKDEKVNALFGILINKKLMLIKILFFSSFVIYFDRKMAKSYKQIIKRLKEEKKKLEVKK